MGYADAQAALLDLAETPQPFHKRPRVTLCPVHPTNPVSARGLDGLERHGDPSNRHQDPHAGQWDRLGSTCPMAPGASVPVAPLGSRRGDWLDLPSEARERDETGQPQDGVMDRVLGGSREACPVAGTRHARECGAMADAQLGLPGPRGSVWWKPCSPRRKSLLRDPMGPKRHRRLGQLVSRVILPDAEAISHRDDMVPTATAPAFMPGAVLAMKGALSPARHQGVDFLDPPGHARLSM